MHEKEKQRDGEYITPPQCKNQQIRRYRANESCKPKQAPSTSFLLSPYIFFSLFCYKRAERGEIIEKEK